MINYILFLSCDGWNTYKFTKNVRIGMFGGVCGEMFGGMFGGYIVFSVVSSSSSFDFPEHAGVFPVVCNSQLALNRSLLESKKEAQRPGAS